MTESSVTAQHVNGMRFEATADGHTVPLDAAPKDGGGGTAMSAPQLLVAAWGACLLEFVLNSCRLRGVSVERLSVEMAYLLRRGCVSTLMTIGGERDVPRSWRRWRSWPWPRAGSDGRPEGCRAGRVLHLS